MKYMFRGPRFYKLVEWKEGADPYAVEARFWRALPRVPPQVGRNVRVMPRESQMLLDKGRPFVVNLRTWHKTRRALNRLFRDA